MQLCVIDNFTWEALEHSCVETPKKAHAITQNGSRKNECKAVVKYITQMRTGLKHHIFLFKMSFDMRNPLILWNDMQPIFTKISKVCQLLKMKKKL